MRTPAPDDMPGGMKCPSCGRELNSNAVLCIACGYHLKLERHLATLVGREVVRPVDLNPYASPAVPEPIQRQPEPFVGDLTPAGAQRAQAIVAEAANAYAVAAASLFCAPLAIFLFPWFSYRLWWWYRLNAQYSELRNPNSFSPHGDMAASFQDAKGKLWIGWIAGLICWLLWGTLTLVRTFVGPVR